MTFEKIIFELIHLPRQFEQLGNVSFCSLLKSIGYCKVRDKISQGDILKTLVMHPSCINDWLNYSEDKRTEQGWYFKQDDTTSYVVGYFDSVHGCHSQREYVDSFKACANFIKNELDDICEGVKS